MPLTDLISTLSLDLGDPDGHLFTEESLSRCLLKGLFPLSRDLAVTYRVVDDEIQPELGGEARELLLLLGQIHACQLMRASTANGFSFSSGDKRVDKSKQPEHWAKLEADLKQQYKQRFAVLQSDGGSASTDDEVLLTPGLVRPVVYEQGSEV
ncbi:hypothetical protein SCOR_15190 [Sulfidibacter corallicola]|uniref:Uncharacterized protein n=1 Tax=Sulfidibacter corallicola TaxID=2818388 RepID=A0A8A4TXX5_SULCO|nr:hypothetical protein [Sulfidibacter corallicola]QTD54187.1 hypothetical protein J3U87_17210 [Sulfidibacter corallicola]